MDVGTKFGNNSMSMCPKPPYMCVQKPSNPQNEIHKRFYFAGLQNFPLCFILGGHKAYQEICFVKIPKMK